MKETKNFKCCKRLINNNFSKSQVGAVHRSWVICRNVPRKFIVELSMQTPYWCTSEGHHPEINESIILELTFAMREITTYHLS